MEVPKEQKQKEEKPTTSKMKASIDILHMAAVTGNIDEIDKQLEELSVDAADDQGWTALHWAAFTGHLPVVQHLVKREANIYARSHQNYTAAYYASNETQQFLLQREFELLANALFYPDLQILRNLLATGADLDSCDAEGNNIACLAAEYGKLDALKLLITQFGSDEVLKYKNKAGKSVLELAEEYHDSETFDYLSGIDLVEKQTDETTQESTDLDEFLMGWKGEDSPMGTAITCIQQRKLDELKALLDTSPSLITAQDKTYGGSLLHWACYFGQEEIVKFLFHTIQEKRKVFILDHQRQSPIHWLARSRYARGSTLEYLFEHAPKKKLLLRSPDEVGKIIILADGFKELCGLKDNEEQTALTCALKQKNFSIATNLYNLGKITVLRIGPHISPAHCPRDLLRATSEIVDHPAELPIEEAFRLKPHAQMVHQSQKGEKKEKYRYSIGDIHHQLRIDQNSPKTPQGNTITVDLSFEILITHGDQEIRDVIHFPLKIPNTSSFNHSNLDNPQGSPREVLRKLYYLGRRIVGMPVQAVHGHKPKYNGNSTDEQLIRHSEQTLAVYLCSENAARMIANRLIAEIRAKHPEVPNGATIKIYSAALHIHSDKTACAPCEFTLIGLQNTWATHELTGFTEYLEAVLVEKTLDHHDGKPNGHFKFVLPGHGKPLHPPEKKGIRLFTTYSADAKDGSHKARIPNVPVPGGAPTIIPTHSRDYSRKIGMVNLGTNLKNIVSDSKTNLSDRTIFLSGSNSTGPTKKTKSCINEKADSEFDLFEETMRSLSLEDENLEVKEKPSFKSSTALTLTNLKQDSDAIDEEVDILEDDLEEEYENQVSVSDSFDIEVVDEEEEVIEFEVQKSENEESGDAGKKNTNNLFTL